MHAQKQGTSIWLHRLIVFVEKSRHDDDGIGGCFPLHFFQGSLAKREGEKESVVCCLSTLSSRRGCGLEQERSVGLSSLKAMKTLRGRAQHVGKRRSDGDSVASLTVLIDLTECKTLRNREPQFVSQIVVQFYISVIIMNHA